MSLLYYKEIQQSYNKYIVPFAKYCTDTWEDDLTGIYYLCETDLLFPEIDLRESIFDDSNYTDVFIGSIAPYTLRAEIDNQDEECIAEESSMVPVRLKRFCYCKLNGIKVGE